LVVKLLDKINFRIFLVIIIACTLMMPFSILLLVFIAYMNSIPRTPAMT
jgi:hypothetical protein